MNAFIWKGACVAIVLAATTGLAAQGASTTTAAGATDITLTGCIEKAEAPAAGGGAGFVLTNVTAVTVPARYPDGAITRIYRLDGDAARISPHVGHKVAITGALAAAPNSDKPPSGLEKAAPAPTAANAPMVKVTAVKMMGPTCS
jgi:hypothetical protein